MFGNKIDRIIINLAGVKKYAELSDSMEDAAPIQQKTDVKYRVSVFNLSFHFHVLLPHTAFSAMSSRLADIPYQIAAYYHNHQ